MCVHELAQAADKTNEADNSTKNVRYQITGFFPPTIRRARSSSSASASDPRCFGPARACLWCICMRRSHSRIDGISSQSIPTTAGLVASH